MSDAVMVPREAVSQIKARLMSYLFGACQPDHGSVFGWFDDHADEALEFALRDALAASTPVGGWEEPDEQDVLDTISDAIGDSMDLDWTYSIGAKAIVEAFKREGWTVSAPPPPSVSIGSRPQEAILPQTEKGS